MLYSLTRRRAGRVYRVMETRSRSQRFRTALIKQWNNKKFCKHYCSSTSKSIIIFNLIVLSICWVTRLKYIERNVDSITLKIV